MTHYRVEVTQDSRIDWTQNDAESLCREARARLIRATQDGDIISAEAAMRDWRCLELKSSLLSD